MPLQKQVVSLDLQGLDKKEDPLKGIPSKPVRLDDAVFEESNSIRMRNIVDNQPTTVLNPPTALLGSVVYSGPKRVFTNQGSLLIENRMTGVHHAVAKDKGVRLVDVAEQRFVDGAGTATYQALRPGASSITTQVGNAINLLSNIAENRYQYDCAGNSSRSCWAVEQGYLSGIMIYVVDEATQKVVNSYQVRNTSGSRVYCNPRVIYAPAVDTFYVYFANYVVGAFTFIIECLSFAGSGALSYPTFNNVMTSAVSGTAIGNSGFEALFDVVNDQFNTARLFFLARDVDASFTLQFKELNASTGYTTAATATKVPATKPTSITAFVAHDGTTKWYHGLYSTALGVFSYSWDRVGAVSALRTLASTTNNGRITAWADNDATSPASANFELYYERYSTAVGTTLVPADIAGLEINLLLPSKDTTSASTPIPLGNLGGQLLQSRVAMNNAAADLTDQGALYRGVISTFLASTTQPTVLAYENRSYSLGSLFALYPSAVTSIASAQHPVARIAPAEAGYESQFLYPLCRRLPSGFWKNANEYVLPHCKFVADLQIESDLNVTPFVLSRSDLDFNSQLGQSEVNGITVMAGGCPSVYDGNSLYEEGSHVGPEVLDASLTAAPAGTYAFPGVIATFNICFTYGWMDARGNWYESAPSNPVSVSTTAVNFAVSPNLLKPPSRKSQRRLLVYRTLNGVPTGPYYRAFSRAGAAFTDAQLPDQEQLYTNPSSTVGAPLFHSPMRSHRQSCVFQNRIWSFGCDDGYRIDFTNVVQEGRAPEPNELLYRRVPTSMGRLVGGAALDGKLFIFGEKQIGVLYGTGPTDSGAQDNYSEVEVIVPDTGASWGSPKSIIATKEGIWFFSQLGIRLLGRDGQIVRKQDGKEAGSEVDEYCTTQYQETPTLVAVQAGNPQQIRFYGTLGSVSNCCLVYDCFWKQWSRFTNHGCVDAAYADGRFYHVRSDADIWYYGVLNSGGSTDPDGTALQVVLETPWLAFGGVQGFQRVYGLQMLTTYIPQQDGTDTQNIAYSINVAYDREAVGTDYKVDIEPAGVNDSVLQLLYKLDRQKCSALRFKLTFKLTNDVMFRISDLALLVGIKGGLNRTANRI